MKPQTFPLDQLYVENERLVSDVKSLAESILLLGQLQPIIADSNGKVISGRRRLAALRLLGRSVGSVIISDTFDDALNAVLAEAHENTERQPLTPWESFLMYERIITLHKEAAAARRKAGKRPSGSTPGAQIVGESRSLASKAVGRSKESIVMMSDINEALEHESKAVRKVACEERKLLSTLNGPSIVDCWRALQAALREYEGDTGQDPPPAEPEAEWLGGDDRCGPSENDQSEIVVSLPKQPSEPEPEPKQASKSEPKPRRSAWAVLAERLTDLVENDEISDEEWADFMKVYSLLQQWVEKRIEGAARK